MNNSSFNLPFVPQRNAGGYNAGHRPLIMNAPNQQYTNMAQPPPLPPPMHLGLSGLPQSHPVPQPPINFQNYNSGPPPINAWPPPPPPPIAQQQMFINTQIMGFQNQFPSSGGNPPMVNGNGPIGSGFPVYHVPPPPPPPPPPHPNAHHLVLPSMGPRPAIALESEEEEINFNGMSPEERLQAMNELKQMYSNDTANFNALMLTMPILSQQLLESMIDLRLFDLEMLQTMKAQIQNCITLGNNTPLLSGSSSTSPPPPPPITNQQDQDSGMDIVRKLLAMSDHELSLFPLDQRNEIIQIETPTTLKRDYLIAIQNIVQGHWADEKVFETDSNDEREKYFVNFPFPYMNGKLHLGHSFTMSKCEFAASFERMNNKNVLFPFGFHVTGMPIKSCADKLAREMELYGVPPNYANDHSETNSSVVMKSKVAAKTGNVTSQWQLLQSIGVPESEIPRFADATYWLSYFPPLAKQDIEGLGLKVDWRRSFITTPANPFFDSFVSWQFQTLNDLKKIKFGKRNTVFSPKDGQPCMDHDRQSGEGVAAQSYSLIKMDLLDYKHNPAFIKDVLPHIDTTRKVYLVAGTLRPETMYGQTNCWVKPDMDYVLIEIEYKRMENVDLVKEYIVCGEHAAKNLSYQLFTPVFGEVSIIAKINGSALLGAKVKAPFAKYDYIYVLPMPSIKENKGTGIVTSVPSDSPDDYINFKEIQKKKEFYLSQYPSLSNEALTDFVDNFSVVEIINVPELGNNSAEYAINMFKINSPKDSDALQKAKEFVYLKGFSKGTLLVGDEYKGRLVNECKADILNKLLSSNLAIPNYNEPEKEVISRSGDVCVVALVDQWYIDYGELEWKESVKSDFKTINTYCEETNRGFLATIDWLREWACSRSYGLGSVLPWDPKYLIESLSDSTIYMAYYTIAHYFHANSLIGENSPYKIKPTDMTRDVWDCILLRKDTACLNIQQESSLTIELIHKMQREFDYWYPFDLRVSGKDLVPNHLTFSIFIHNAVWGSEKTPKAIRSNGHLMLNGEKMSKSTGNFMTLHDAISEFGSDATRIALADAGDGIEDANFSKLTANAVILKLYSFVDWATEFITLYGSSPAHQYSPGNNTSDNEKSVNAFIDSVLFHSVQKALIESHDCYSRMHYREALKVGYYDLQTARDNYILYVANTEGAAINKDLMLTYIYAQTMILTPFAPHVCEYLLSALKKATNASLKKLLCENGIQETTLAVNAQWPVSFGAYDKPLLQAYIYLNSTIYDFRKTMKTQISKASKKNPASSLSYNSVNIYLADDYANWQKSLLSILHALYFSLDETERAKFDDNKHILTIIKTDKEITPHMKKVMPFIQFIKDKVSTVGPQVLDPQSAFTGLYSDEKLFVQNAQYIKKCLGLSNITTTLVHVNDKEQPPFITKKILDDTQPFNPVAEFS